MKPNLWAVVTCMGRLEHLRQTLPLMLKQPGLRTCLVDFCCPDRSGDWVERTFPEETSAGTVLVERVRGHEFFNKCVALNAGARRALQQGADYLCFLDADTLIAPEFSSWVSEHLEPRRFLIAALGPDGKDEMSLTGVLILHRSLFEEAGGYDDTFRGWGAEDIEYRIRLFLLHGIPYGEIPLSLIRAIGHDNELRSRYYEEQNIQLTNHRNLSRLHHKVWRQWQGRWKNDLSAAERLWFHARGSRPVRGSWGPLGPRPGDAAENRDR